MKKSGGLLGLALVFCVCSACAPTSGGLDGPKDDSVQVKYYQTANDLMDALKSGEETVGVLPEPLVGDLLYAKSDFSAQMNLQEAFGEYVQDVVVAKKSVIERDGKFISAITDGIRQGAAWLKNNGHDGVEQVHHNLFEVQTPMLTPNITREIVDRYQIAYKSATDAKAGLLSYIQKLNSVQEHFASVPSDNFFYDGESVSENQDGAYTVVAPDGVSALALAQLMYYDRLGSGVGRDVEYRVVTHEAIENYVMNANGSALGDVVILSALAAIELVGSGDVYQTVGVATSGYQYIVSAQTIAGVDDWKGKRIGVVGKGETVDLILQYVCRENQIVYKKVD